jgi:hypothetical protein
LRPDGHALITQVPRRDVIRKETRRINNRHQRIKLRQVGQTGAFSKRKGKGHRNRQRLGDAGRLDQQVVEPILTRQASHFDEQILAQSAADAAIGQFDQLLFGTTERGAAAAHKLGVDIDLAHIVDDDGDALPGAVGKHVIEQCRLPGAEEAGEHRDGQRAKGVLLISHR